MRSVKMLAIVVLGLMVSLAMVGKAEPMGTAWTYQGRLMDTTEPADGLYDFQFKLFNDPCTGTQQGSTIEINDLDVIDGYFTAELDFGSSVFNGDARWLEIDVRPGDSYDISDYATLSPRQEVTPTPYALSVRVPLELSSQETGPVITATNIADDDDGIGVYGEATGRSGYGIYGKATGDDSSGVHGEATGEDGTGVLGYASGDASYGVQGSHIDSSTAGRLGGFSYGVWGRHYDSGNYGYIGSENYAGYFDGNTVVTGNVGIGTENPTAKLEVAGNLKTAAINEDASGNVGIGTISPQAKLHVDGGLQIGSNSDSVKIHGMSMLTGQASGALRTAAIIEYPDGYTESNCMVLSAEVENEYGDWYSVGYFAGSGVGPSHVYYRMNSINIRLHVPDHAAFTDVFWKYRIVLMKFQ